MNDINDINDSFAISLLTKVQEIYDIARPFLTFVCYFYRENNWVADHFEKTVKVSAYLLAFMVCDFTYKEAQTTRGTRVKKHVYRSKC